MFSLIPILTNLTYLFFLTWLIRNILYWLFLWQVKEYRRDRLLVHLRETSQGKTLLFDKFNILKISLLLMYLFLFVSTDPNITFALSITMLLLYGAEAVRVAKEIKEQRLRKPVFTVKTIAIILISLLVIFSAIIQVVIPDLIRDPYIKEWIPAFAGMTWINSNHFFWLLLVDKITPFLVSLCIGIFAIPSYFYHQIIIRKAKKKMLLHPKMTVIGITGCYGKGSTKEYVAAILSEKFTVATTFETHNTPIGIARTILTQISDKTEYFIVEIGAYKRGETAEICELVRPEIGIITPVEDQHLSLFGSIENLKSATFELIENLPPALGLALFDGNSEHTKQLYEKTDGSRIEKILCYAHYSASDKIKKDVSATDITVNKFSISFDVFFKQTHFGRFTAQLIGRHHIENIVPGIFLAKRFGMKIDEIKKAVSTITPWKKTMEPYINDKEAVFVDDSFNASPGATAAAVEYMKLYNGKKVLVLQPFIELANNARRDHKRIGVEIGNVCDILFLTNKNHFEDIVNGINETKSTCEVKVANPAEIIHLVHILEKNDIVVFEGKEAGVSLLRMLPGLKRVV